MKTQIERSEQYFDRSRSGKAREAIAQMSQQAVAGPVTL